MIYVVYTDDELHELPVDDPPADCDDSLLKSVIEEDENA
jgi:hypothetical protein